MQVVKQWLYLATTSQMLILYPNEIYDRMIDELDDYYLLREAKERLDYDEKSIIKVLLDGLSFTSIKKLKKSGISFTQPYMNNSKRNLPKD